VGLSIYCVGLVYEKDCGMGPFVEEPICGIARGFRKSDRERVSSRGKGSRVETDQ
jgi:hypothetical protein